MLYFAYGSNLNHFQMKRRCKDSKYIKKINLKGYTLNFRSKYRAADIEKKINSIVPGGLYEISKNSFFRHYVSHHSIFVIFKIHFFIKNWIIFINIQFFFITF